MSPRLLLIFGTAFSFLSVALGAFGAHALKEKLSPYFISVFKTGVEYQIYHSLALMILAVLTARAADPGLFRTAGILFTVGIIIFSGSLYLLALTQVKLWGAVTPIGGVCFLVGWLLTIVAAFRATEI
jgi:uncharacterized membrane protein YgdD (TMEM256/DUF423 family)